MKKNTNRGEIYSKDTENKKIKIPKEPKHEVITRRSPVDQIVDINIEQITKMGVEAPKTIDIEIKETENFKKLPVEVLKFIPGDEDVSRTILEFDNGDKYDFQPQKYVEFDESMYLKTNHKREFENLGKLISYSINEEKGEIKFEEPIEKEVYVDYSYKEEERKNEVIKEKASTVDNKKFSVSNDDITKESVMVYIEDQLITENVWAAELDIEEFKEIKNLEVEEG